MKVFDPDCWQWGEVLRKEGKQNIIWLPMGAGARMKFWTDEEVKEHQDKKLFKKNDQDCKVVECFGCFISPEHPWAEYISPNDLFDKNGKFVKTLDAVPHWWILHCENARRLHDTKHSDNL